MVELIVQALKLINRLLGRGRTKVRDTRDDRIAWEDRRADLTQTNRGILEFIESLAPVEYDRTWQEFDDGSKCAEEREHTFKQRLEVLRAAGFIRPDPGAGVIRISEKYAPYMVVRRDETSFGADD